MGVIGTGQVYRRLYLPALRRLRITAQATADPGPGRDAAAYIHPEAMLAAESIDRAIVLSPPALHAQHVALCASKGIRVLVEKPPAVSVREVQSWEHPELVTPAFSRRYWRRYNGGPRTGGRWHLTLQTSPDEWGALEPEPVSRDLLPHAADLATWLSDEEIEDVNDIRRSDERASGTFRLSKGGEFSWELAHGGRYVERLTLDGKLHSEAGESFLSGLRRRALGQPAEEIEAVAQMLGDWLHEAVSGRPRLATLADALSCARVIETVEATENRDRQA
jgi:predicted dehydrogenase